MPTGEIRWGILGPGNIARDFATGLTSVPDARLVAVGSRAQEKAEAFGRQFGATQFHGSYEALAQNPEVDIIYIATPHPMHAENARLCLDAGKAVLCEKPFTINADQARAVIETARSRKRFLMEGMWSRFYPAMARLRELAHSGVIGEPRMLHADFGFRAGFNPTSRLFDPALGGGALMDVGVYCVSLASMLFGKPAHVAGVASVGETGVDEQSAMTLLYARGEIAVLSTAIRTNTPHEALLIGTEGRIQVQSPWWKPAVLTVSSSGKPAERIEIPYEGNGFNYEAQEAGDCLRAGKLESAVMPLDESLAIMETMDALRAQWGVRYPME